MTAVYFWQRPFHRERQRETVAQLPPAYTAVVPRHPPTIPDHAVNLRARLTLRGRLAAAARHLPAAVNAGVVTDPAVRRCALIYTWGKIPIYPPRPPFVVELDNPYVLALYHNPKALFRVRPALRRTLLSPRCAGLVCISDACRNSTAAILGDDVAERARVIYPFVADGPLATPGTHDQLELLFVGTQFWLKGGRELCAAFAKVATDAPGVRLTIISRVPPDIRHAYAAAPIRFVEATLPKAELRERYLERSDVFVLPTMQESFGLAVLEALAAGLPIVTTKVYALTELVRHAHNGLLLDDPLGMWHGAYADSALWRISDIDTHVKRLQFPQLQAQLEASIRALVGDRARIRAMAASSRELFQARFAPGRRSSRFIEMLESYIPTAPA